jgi:hypothetical protein
MSDLIEEDQTDGLECFKFQLFLDDYITGSQKKEKTSFLSASKPRENMRALTNSERRAHHFENLPSEQRNSMEKSFRKVYEMINEQEPPDSALPASEKKSKKGQKHLTPETNYTQKDVDLEEDALSFKSGGQKRDFNIWGSYRWSREEETHSKKTLTAYSEAYEPENIRESQEKASLAFDLDAFRLARVPKKNSMALPEGTLDLMQALRAPPRKLSFQQDRPLDLQKELPIRFLLPEKKAQRRFSSFVMPSLEDTFRALEARVDSLIREHSSAEFPKLG